MSEVLLPAHRVINHLPFPRLHPHKMFGFSLHGLVKIVLIFLRGLLVSLEVQGR
ncbi:putative glucosamine-fructose-6-phosphate [Listeria monocytogenes]|nr:putative glucosamine-fructose-6-phosphate [Listeria monocytogenes]